MTSTSSQELKTKSSGIKASKPALGRGMSALLGEMDTANELMNTQAGSFSKNKEVANEKDQVQFTKVPLEVELSLLIQNPEQPRKIFDTKEIEELADSIKSLGLIQPILVKKINDKQYQIIAGERRYRAAKIAGLERVPVVIKEVSEREQLVLSIVENVQRADLNCVEEALAYFQLMTEFSLTQEQVAQQVGKNRSTIANFIRILKLPKSVIKLLQEKSLTYGHAKLLVSLDPSRVEYMAQSAVAKGWSVRELEKQIQSLASSHKNKKQEATDSLSEQRKILQEKLGKVKRQLESQTGFHFAVKEEPGGGGTISIKFSNEAELNDVYNFLNRRR